MSKTETLSNSCSYTLHFIITCEFKRSLEIMLFLREAANPEFPVNSYHVPLDQYYSSNFAEVMISCACERMGAILTDEIDHLISSIGEMIRVAPSNGIITIDLSVSGVNVVVDEVTI